MDSHYRITSLTGLSLIPQYLCPFFTNITEIVFFLGYMVLGDAVKKVTDICMDFEPHLKAGDTVQHLLINKCCSCCSTNVEQCVMPC